MSQERHVCKSEVRISHIGKLRDFLLEHRKDYINAYRMTDAERDQIDQDAQIFMRTCSEAIQQLRTEAHKEIHSQQVKEHRTALLDFIQDYLKKGEEKITPNGGEEGQLHWLVAEVLHGLVRTGWQLPPSSQLRDHIYEPCKWRKHFACGLPK
ncbi:syntaxin-18-like isoform X1 [Urocitellus parryii]